MERGQIGGTRLGRGGGGGGRTDCDVPLCCGVAPEGQRGQGLHGERGQETDHHGSAHQVSVIGMIG